MDYKWTELLATAGDQGSLYVLAYGAMKTMVEHFDRGELTGTQLCHISTLLAEDIEEHSERLRIEEQAKAEEFFKRAIKTLDTPDAESLLAIYVTDDQAPERGNQE